MKLRHNHFPKQLVLWLIILGGLVVISSCSSTLQLLEESDGITIHTYARSFINIHYVETDGKVLLIDSGNVGDSAKIERYFAKKGLDLSGADYLIITHGHADHAGNARYFQEKYGVKIIAGAAERKMITSRGEDPNLCPRGFNGWLIDKTIGGRHYRPFVPDFSIRDTFDLSTLGIRGQIVPTPGHTPGSITTFIKDKAFVGDLISARPFDRDKPDYHVFMCDLDENLREIERIAGEAQIEEWYLGHFGPLSVADVKAFIQNEKRPK